jgi:hypothetical protein
MIDDYPDDASPVRAHKTTAAIDQKSGGEPVPCPYRASMEQASL